MKKVKLYLPPEYIECSINGLLVHQEETLNALELHNIVMNCAMTGAGKTRAAHLAVEKFAVNQSVLFVAPTNALVWQHFDDAKEFVQKRNLPHKIVPVDGNLLFRLQQKRPELKRPSAVLHRIIDNPRLFADELNLDDKSAPLWLITNPDQIWLSIVKGRDQDTRNLLIDFVNKFRFVVVDEFHYYNAQQLTLFLLCIALWHHFGQFVDGLKLLLLTATPDHIVLDFFEQMGFCPAIVGLPNKKFAKSLTVLAPIELTLTTGKIHDYLEQVITEVNKKNDSVIISDSLLDINLAYQFFRKKGLFPGRITGPVKRAQREKEADNSIILATPTVDLGYNFKKTRPKQRQEVDFLLSTARTKSNFWQRLGRAGRVLGKKDTDIPSKVTMILPFYELYKNLTIMNEKEITRKQLNDLLNLRDKNLQIYSLTREGLYTVTAQLLEIERMLSCDKRTIVEEIFKTLKSCLDPYHLTGDWNSYRKRHYLHNTLKRIAVQYPLLKKNDLIKKINKIDTDQKQNDSLLVLIYAAIKNYFFRRKKLDYYYQFINQYSRYDLIKLLYQKKPSILIHILNYYNEQRILSSYLFNFRGTNNFLNDIYVYDPDNIYSPHIINKINPITLISRYQISKAFSKAEAEKQWKIRLYKGKIFFQIYDILEYPYKPIFFLNDKLPSLPEELKYYDEQDNELLPVYWKTIVLHNLNIQFVNQIKGILAISPQIKKFLSSISEVFFVTPFNNRFQLSNWLKQYDIQQGTLRVKTDTADQEYEVIIGKSAIFISEELYFKNILQESPPKNKFFV